MAISYRQLTQSQSYTITTDGQSASLSWNKAPIWGLRPDLDYCLTVAGLLAWGVHSDERTGLSFAIATGPRQRSHFRVRVPYDSWPYFTVSDSRLPFSSPPTTRRVTVERYSSPPPHGLDNWLIRIFSLYRLGSDFTENTCLVSEWVFIGPLPSTGHGADHIENSSSTTFSIVASAYFGRCLEMGLHVTIITVSYLSADLLPSFKVWIICHCPYSGSTGIRYPVLKMKSWKYRYEWS
jgi:hypothetical protein